MPEETAKASEEEEEVALEDSARRDTRRCGLHRRRQRRLHGEEVDRRIQRLIGETAAVEVPDRLDDRLDA